MCGNYAGVSRKNNEIRCYYTCQGRKEKKDCTKKAVHRDTIEKIVLDNTMKIILQDDFIEKIATKIFDLNQLEDESSGLITAYETEQQELKNKIDNILTAIENGVASKRMMERISELENREQELEEQINFQKMKIHKTLLTKEQIIYWLTMFKDGDIHSEEFCNKLIDLFIDKVVAHQDKIEIHYNYMDKAHQESIHFFNPKSLDTEHLEVISLSESKTLKLGKDTFYLEILL